MKKQTWLITGVSSGFGIELTKQLLANGQTVIGTVRKDTTVQELMAQYPETFDREFLDVTDATGIKTLVDKVYEKYGAIDVLVNNAGYGLFGAAEELTDQNVAKIIATNLTGSIQMIRAVTPFMREQQAGRIIQLSSYWWTSRFCWKFYVSCD
ncbi:SDR family NAD(P)-dependent oxidoreductase [Enterococcus sp. AZ177]|uniref:SDR family NAD(P)-dependent oxidoreductase n=1 Tax=unclassified Enterococcus TaxID=2608891 RepID=UPI003D2FDBAE